MTRLVIRRNVFFLRVKSPVPARHPDDSGEIRRRPFRRFGVDAGFVLAHIGNLASGCNDSLHLAGCAGRNEACSVVHPHRSRHRNNQSPTSCPRETLAVGLVRKESTMNRWQWMASLGILLFSSTGCLHHHTRHQAACGPECSECDPGTACGPMGCRRPVRDALGNIFACGCGRTGCVPGPVGWMQGGLNYSSHLCPSYGTAGHGCGTGAFAAGMAHGEACASGACGSAGAMAGGACGAGGVPTGLPGSGPGGLAGMHPQPPMINPGPPSAQVAYPYYTHRGPRDFLLDNPPSIGR